MRKLDTVVTNGTEVSNNELIEVVTRVSEEYGYKNCSFEVSAMIENGDLKIQADFTFDKFNETIQNHRFSLYFQGLDGDCIYTTEDNETLVNEKQFDYVVEKMYNVGDEYPMLERQLGVNGTSILKMMMGTDYSN